jgi:hypothetical protein
MRSTARFTDREYDDIMTHTAAARKRYLNKRLYYKSLLSNDSVKQRSFLNNGRSTAIEEVFNGRSYPTFYHETRNKQVSLERFFLRK